MVDVREVFIETVFDHDEADDEIVPCMVLRLIFLNLLSQSSLDEVVLHQFVIGLAVVLVPHEVVGHCLIGVAVAVLRAQSGPRSPQI